MHFPMLRFAQDMIVCLFVVGHSATIDRNINRSIEQFGLLAFLGVLWGHINPASRHRSTWDLSASLRHMARSRRNLSGV